MKKIILSLALFATCMVGNAQTQIKANFQKGDSAVYASTILMHAGKDVESKMKAETNYVVQDVQADGYIIKTTMTDLTTEGDVADDVIFQTLSMQKGVTLIIKTDLNGKPIKLINYVDVKNVCAAYCKNMIEEMAADNPEFFEQMSKENMIDAMINQLTEEKLLDDADQATGFFALYGKTLKTGDVESNVERGIKINTTYQVTPMMGKLTVIGKSECAMSNEEVKTMFMEQIDKAGLPADQAAMIKAQYDQIAAMGMAKIVLDGEDTYLFQKNSWLQESKMTYNMDMFGETITSNINASCKFLNR